MLLGVPQGESTVNRTGDLIKNGSENGTLRAGEECKRGRGVNGGGKKGTRGETRRDRRPVE